MVDLVVPVVFVLYLAACSWVAQRVTSRLKPGFPRSSAMVSIIALLLAAPYIDGLYGYIRLKQICAKESGTTIYGHLRISKNTFEASIKPVFLDKYGNIRWSSINSFAVLQFNEVPKYRGVNGLKRVRNQIIRVSDGLAIAEWTDIYFSGGWLRLNGGGLGAARCLADISADNLLKKILVIGD